MHPSGRSLAMMSTDSVSAPTKDIIGSLERRKTVLSLCTLRSTPPSTTLIEHSNGRWSRIARAVSIQRRPVLPRLPRISDAGGSLACARCLANGSAGRAANAMWWTAPRRGLGIGIVTAGKNAVRFRWANPTGQRWNSPFYTMGCPCGADDYSVWNAAQADCN
ncbi:hypothetical protein VTN96DRAFT_8277 [Rasamsonia emersonii]